MIRCTSRLGAALVVAAALFGEATAAAEPDELTAGVSLELAKARARNISRLSYELALSIPDTLAQPVTGTNVLRFHLADPAMPLVVDFDADGAAEATITANGTVVPTRAVNGHLVIPAAPLRRGENTVRIDFRAGDAPLNSSADLLYTWFVPAQARRALPCFDQPDLKGRWTVTLEHPANWQSVANGAEQTGPGLKPQFSGGLADRGRATRRRTIPHLRTGSL